MAADIDYFEFKNKELLESHKAEGKNLNRGKKLKLLNEEDNCPKLFLLFKIQAGNEYLEGKKMENEQKKKALRKKEESSKEKKTKRNEENCIQRFLICFTYSIKNICCKKKK